MRIRPADVRPSARERIVRRRRAGGVLCALLVVGLLAGCEPAGDARCTVAPPDRVTRSYVTPFEHADLDDPDQGKRDAAWEVLVDTMYHDLCITSLALTSLQDRAAPGGETRYYASSSPQPVGGQVDVLGSLFRAIDHLNSDGATGFTVVPGLRSSVQRGTNWAEWSDSLASVATSGEAVAWADAQRAASVALATDVWNSYPTQRDKISGWHFTAEPSPTVLVSSGGTIGWKGPSGSWDSPRTEAFRRYLASTTRALHHLSPRRRTQVAPAFEPGSSPTTDWKPFLTALLRGPGVAAGEVAVDTVEVQDRLWARTRTEPFAADLDGAVPFFEQARSVVDAINAANAGVLPDADENRSTMQLRSNVELFEEGTPFASIPVRFIIEALRSENPYVDGFSAYSPQVHWMYGSETASYFTFGTVREEGRVYRDWARSGTPSSARPNRPALTVGQEGADVVVEVTATDTVPTGQGGGISQVWIMRRDGSGPERRVAVCQRSTLTWLVTGCDIDRQNRNPVVSALSDDGKIWQFRDPQVPPGSTVSYRAMAINRTGWERWSDPSAAFTVSPTVHGAANLAAGRPYARAADPATGQEASPPVDGFAFRSDTGHVPGGPGEATDGLRGTPDPFAAVWHGFNSPSLASVDTTVDLGAPAVVGEIQIDVLHLPSAGITAPSRVDVLVSSDGSNWSSWAVAWRPDLPTGSTPTPLTYRVTGPSARARYVRVKAPRSQWLYLAEIAVYAP